MQPTEFELFLKTYGGWLGLVLYFMYNRLWPFIAKKSITEAEFHRQMDLRRIEAQEKIAEAVATVSNSITQTNERIATIMANQALMLNRQDATHNALLDAVSDMKATVGVNKRKGD